MVEKIKNVKPSRGLTRLGWRAPIWFYRLGLGDLLSERFVLLNHIGRKSGQPRQAVLEVVYHNIETGAYVVASGFGEKSDWYRNVIAHPEITIQVGQKRMAARAGLDKGGYGIGHALNRAQCCGRRSDRNQK